MSNKKLVITLAKNKPSAGAGGAHEVLCFDLRTLSNFFKDHFFSPRYFKTTNH